MKQRQAPRNLDDNTLTPEVAAELVFESFRHSQGDFSDLQETFIWLTTRLRPTWKETKAMERIIQTDAFRDRIQKFVNSEAHAFRAGYPQPTSRAEIAMNIDRALSSLKQSLKRKRLLDDELNEIDPEIEFKMELTQFLIKTAKQEQEFLGKRKRSNLILFICGVERVPGPKVVGEVLARARELLKDITQKDISESYSVMGKQPAQNIKVIESMAKRFAENIYHVVKWYNMQPKIPRKIDISEFVSPQMLDVIANLAKKENK